MNNYGYPQNYVNPYSRPYNGVGGSYLQPQYAPQQPMMQPQMQQAPQEAQYETPIQATIFATLKEAEAKIMYPNSKILFIDVANGMSYLKFANNDGQSFMRYFKNVEVSADGTPLQSQKEEKSVDYSTFATKDDLAQFITVKEHKELLSKIEQLQKLVGGKGNATSK